MERNPSSEEETARLRGAYLLGRAFYFEKSSPNEADNGQVQYIFSQENESLAFSQGYLDAQADQLRNQLKP